MISETQARTILSVQLTRKLSTAGKEGFDVIFMEAVVLQHSVELLKILDVMLERHLLLPTSCSVQTHTFRGHMNIAEQSLLAV